MPDSSLQLILDYSGKLQRTRSFPHASHLIDCWLVWYHLHHIPIVLNESSSFNYIHQCKYQSDSWIPYSKCDQDHWLIWINNNSQAKGTQKERNNIISYSINGHFQRHRGPSGFQVISGKGKWADHAECVLKAYAWQGDRQSNLNDCRYAW